ncbi:MAG TPA: hypothetical protein VMV43_05105 [Candidatus Nanopelagicaceae bacterium]|nr:hypothetical protein [Candidatus Nanopelagicaceae bacterium]
MHKYYCKKCKKYHYRGKIYKEHSDYKKEEFNKDDYLDVENTKINLDTLRPIAKRQLRTLLKKMKLSDNHELYKNEINKLIKNEKRQ